MKEKERKQLPGVPRLNWQQLLRRQLLQIKGFGFPSAFEIPPSTVLTQ